MRLVYRFLLGCVLLAGNGYAQTITFGVANPGSSTTQQILDSLRKRPDLKGLKIKLQDINFETNSFRLTPASAVYLDTVASVLNKMPAVILEIGGHTDNVGLPQVNQALSENRARAVRDRLIGPGRIVSSRVTFRGYGEEKPVASNTSEVGRMLNRRVEMQFIGLNSQVVNQIFLRNGQTISAPLVYLGEQNRTILYKTSETAPLRELACSYVLRVAFADGRVQVFDCPAESVPVSQPPPAIPVADVRKPPKLYLQLRGAAGYMIGAQPGWTSKTNGYAHVLGFGGEVLVGYRVTSRIAASLQTGYWRWSTRVEYKESAGGPILRQYHSDATQIPLFVAVPVFLTRSVYLAPEAGANLLMIRAGFDASRDTFSGLQIGYGGAIGYTTDRDKRLWADLSLFYRMHQAATWAQQYGIPVMDYAGLRLGVAFNR